MPLQLINYFDIFLYSGKKRETNFIIFFTLFYNVKYDNGFKKRRFKVVFEL